ncbi:MAG TPA: MFS transporter [Acidimicrobiales bacterium]|nr:MFS transporter [Acidimicrobiales bacterium]
MARETGWSPLRPPRRDHDPELRATPFSRLSGTHALSVSGDALVTLALAGSLFFSISPSEARGRVALSLVLTIAPFGVVAPLLGPAIDRTAGGRRAMVFMASLGRGIAALVAARVLNSLMLFPVAFVLLVLSKTHAVAKSSLVPTVVDRKEDLVEANSRLSLLAALVSIAAAVPGVAVLQLAGGEWVMRLAAVVFAASALASLRIVQVHPDTDPARTRRGVLVARRDSLADMNHPGIRAAATATGVLRAAVGFLTFLIAFALRREGAPAWVFGVVLAASMAGSILGAVAAPALRRRMIEEHLLTGSLGLVVMSALVATRLGGRPAAVVAAGSLGFAASAGKLAFDAVVQRDAPDTTQGRWFARCEAIFQLTWVVGALVPVALAVPSRTGYFLLATGTALAAGAYFAGLRGREAPAPG